MAFLYINPKGKAWRKHSYSAGNDFDVCPYKYYLRRVLGWREQDNKARLRFGRALEEAIQFHHENMGGGPDDFLRRWSEHKADTSLIFTRVEKDWENLNTIGHQMMRLYEIRQRSLPIPLGGSQSLFQREFKREVFPGNADYGEIEDAGKIDIIAMVEPTHPLLPKIDWPLENGVLRPLVVDIKTSGIDFPVTPGIAAYDKQLRRYSWLTGIQDVAILWFKKTTLKITKGCTASLLVDTEDPGMPAGKEVIVASLGDEGCWIVEDEFFIEQMEDYQGYSNRRVDTSKFGTARKNEWLRNNSIFVKYENLTRQRIQFNCGRVTEQSAEDAGRIAARQIVGIVNAWKTKHWENTFGVRYPNDDTRDPFFRAFVLGDTMFQQQNFVKSDDNVMDDMFDDDESEATE
jgi:PD-(D/E)XK nuclease superfamily